jgi:hypothetical protein
METTKMPCEESRPRIGEKLIAQFVGLLVGVPLTVGVIGLSFLASLAASGSGLSAMLVGIQEMDPGPGRAVFYAMAFLAGILGAAICRATTVATLRQFRHRRPVASA